MLRLSPTWRVRQFLLFRDLDEPDLWLATDGHDRWGEVNGAHRPELDGCVDIDAGLLAVPGDAADPPAAAGGRRRRRDAGRHDRRRDARRRRRDAALRARRRAALARHRQRPGDATEFDVDEHGLVIDQPGRFRRRA